MNKQKMTELRNALIKEGLEVSEKNLKLFSPRKGQVVFRNNLWAKRLEENKRKARNTMIDKNGGRCCLRVAEDIMVNEFGVKLSSREFLLPTKLAHHFFGWESDNMCVPKLIINKSNDSLTASNINDTYNLNKSDESLTASDINDKYKQWTGTGTSHKKIAKYVRNTYVHPKNMRF